MQRPVLAFAGVAATASVVLALATGHLGLLAALVVVPLAAVLAGPPRVLAALAAGTLAVAALVGLAGDAFDAPHVASLLAVALASVMAIVLAVEREAREHRAALATFMEEATTLLACSLDFDATAKAVAAIPVPDLADWCLVELVGADGAIERRAASRPDPAAELMAAAIAAAAEGARGPRAELWPELPDALLEAWSAGDAAQLETLRGVHAAAAIRVPLRSADHLLGTITLLGHGFVEEDLRRAEDLAARCALAVENALQYRAARRSGDRRFGRRAEQSTAPPPPFPRSKE